MKHHKYLLTQEFWQQTKEQILNGRVEDFFPYPEEMRFCNAFPATGTPPTPAS
jgi:isocitrate dehydrogenase kinase/phosphatase